MKTIIITLLISFAVQTLFFIFAASFKTDKVTDLSYGLTFFIIVIALLFLAPQLTIPVITLVSMVAIWAIRLAAYLFQRILKIKKDKRFDGIREDFLKFAQFWFFQGLTVWMIMIPFTLYLTKQVDPQLKPLNLLGLFIWLSGLIIETVADAQKFKFKSNPENKGRWIETGLWNYSRHPNYFGEILCWVGVFIYTLPSLTGWEYLSVISPIYITSLLLFVSGIPTLEKKYDERYKDNKKYWNYKESTSVLVPWFKSS